MQTQKTDIATIYDNVDTCESVIDALIGAA